MNRFLAPVIAAALAASCLGTVPALAQTRDDQGEARKQMQQGNVLPLREIERIVLPQMGGWQYLGPAYDSVAMAYRLKFIKDGHVVFVDVDARTGKILSRSNSAGR